MPGRLRFLFVHAWQGFSLAEWCLRDALAGHDVEFHAVDLAADPSPVGDLLPRAVAALRPDLVGFTCHAWTLPAMLEAAGWVRALQPRARIVLGGPQTSHPRAAEEVLRRHRAVDFVIRGHGEVPLARLVEACRGERPLAEVPSLSRREEDGGIVHAAEDATPWRRGHMFHAGNPAARQLDHAPQAAYETTRGCRAGCLYCAYRTVPRGELELDLVRDELSFLCAMRVQHLRFCDAELGGTAPRAKAILRHLAAVNHETSVKVYPGLAHADDEYVSLLAEARAVVTSIGVQTTNPRALEVNRRRSAFRHGEAVERLLRAFPEAPADLIVGLPGDDPAGVERSIRDVLDAGFAAVNLFRLAAFPGTDLAEDVGGRLGGGELVHTSRGVVLASAAFPREAQEELALVCAAAVVAAPLVETRRAISPRRPGSSLLTMAQRLEPEQLLALERAVTGFRPAELLSRLAPLGALAAELGGDRACADALAEDVARLLLRQARGSGRRSFTWCEAGGRIREVTRVAFAAKGGRLLDLGAGRLVDGSASGADVLELDRDLLPLAVVGHA